MVPARLRRFARIALTLFGLGLARALAAQDAPPLGLQNVAELTVVMTSGNATSRTFGAGKEAHPRIVPSIR